MINSTGEVHFQSFFTGLSLTLFSDPEMPVQGLEPTSEGLVFQRLQPLESKENVSHIVHPTGTRLTLACPFPCNCSPVAVQTLTHVGTGVGPGVAQPRSSPGEGLCPQQARGQVHL